MLAMKMNVWQQIRLFLGDLRLARYVRETGWVDKKTQSERERESTEGKTNKTRKMV